MLLTSYIADQIWALHGSRFELAGMRFGGAYDSNAPSPLARSCCIRPATITAAIAEEISALGPVAGVCRPWKFPPFARNLGWDRISRREDVDLPGHRKETARI